MSLGLGANNTGMVLVRVSLFRFSRPLLWRVFELTFLSDGQLIVYVHVACGGQ